MSPGALAAYVRFERTSGVPSLYRARNLSSDVLPFWMDARSSRLSALSAAEFFPTLSLVALQHLQFLGC